MTVLKVCNLYSEARGVEDNFCSYCVIKELLKVNKQQFGNKPGHPFIPGQDISNLSLQYLLFVSC